MTPAPTADVVFRRASTADRDAIEAMVARCSSDSRCARFLAPVHAFPPEVLDRDLGPFPGHEAWIATPRDADDTVVAIGSLARVGPGAEVALLVEDTRQRRGIGTALLDVLADAARDRGLCRLSAVVFSESRHVLRMLRRIASRTSIEADGVTSEVVLDLCA